MKQTPLQIVDQGIRHTLPFGSTLLFVLLNMMPTRVPGLAEISPVLALIAVFYWSIFRPDLLPPWAAFVAGALHDLLSGAPLGVHSLVFLLLQGLGATQRRFFLGLPFVGVWLMFVLIAIATAILAWALVSAVLGQMVPVRPVAVSYAITVALFPLAFWLLAKAQAFVLSKV